MHLSPEDAASFKWVLSVLEQEVTLLGPESQVADMWRDWTDILSGRPSPWQHPWNVTGPSPLTSAPLPRASSSRG